MPFNTHPIARQRLAATVAQAVIAVASAAAVILCTRAVAQVGTDFQMAEASRPYDAAAAHFLERAAAGDLAGTQALLSRALKQRVGDAAVRQSLQAQILPFFAAGGSRTQSVTVTRTTDAAGQSGYAFYMWWQPAAGAAARPFSIYIVLEDGRPMVANVVPDRLVPGRHS